MLTLLTGNAQFSSPIYKQTERKPTRSTRSSLRHTARKPTSRTQVADSDDINMGSDADDLLSEPMAESFSEEVSKNELEHTDMIKDEESVDELLTKRQPLQRRQAKTVLKEVAIPLSGSIKSKGRRGRVLASQSPSSSGSILSTSRDRSAEYDTPATSAVVTPAESLGKGLSSKSLGNPLRGTLPNSKAMTATKGKRKRDDLDELVEADALLAQALQEEEYGEEKPTRGRPRKGPRNLVDDSDDDSVLSDLPLEDPDDVDLPVPKKTKKSQRFSLPTRAARDSARKSITAEASREVLDTDDSDDISFAYSDTDLDSMDDLEDEDDIVFPASTSVVDAPALAPTTASTNRSVAARRIRRRDLRRVNWRQRLREGMQSRVRFCPAYFELKD